MSLWNFDNYDSMLKFRVFSQEYTSPTNFGKYFVFELASTSLLFSDFVKKIFTNQISHYNPFCNMFLDCILAVETSIWARICLKSKRFRIY